MIDTIKFKLDKNTTPNTDFLAETPCYLENVVTHQGDNRTWLTGVKNGLKIICGGNYVSVQNSLCKYYLGDNLQQLGRGDTECAIEKISDELHLPIGKADVQRLDLGVNIITTHPVKAYLNHFGNWGRATRLEQPTSVYYKKGKVQLCIYDKGKEIKNKRTANAELFDGRNVLRFEQRYLSGVARQFGVNEFTAEMLANEQMYIKMLNALLNAYKEITKLNELEMNTDLIKGKKELNQAALICLIERFGGEVAVLEQLENARKMGKLTRKQFFDMKTMILSACNAPDLTTPSPQILELDEKMQGAIKFYR